MARDDDSFWLDIFRKSPLIASFMALGGIIGFGIGFYYFGDIQRMVSLRLILCLLFSTTCGGIFVGLIVGVIMDTFVGTFRGKAGKKRKDKQRNDHIWKED